MRSEHGLDHSVAEFFPGCERMKRVWRLRRALFCAVGFARRKRGADLRMSARTKNGRSAACRRDREGHHVSRHRSRHVERQGAADRCEPGRHRFGDKPAGCFPAASGLVRAGSGRLDCRHRGGSRRPEGAKAGRTVSGEGHRPVGTYARRDAARQKRPGAAPLHLVERHAKPCRGGKARRRSALPPHHRQHRISGVHRAKTRLGQEQ